MPFFTPDFEADVVADEEEDDGVGADDCLDVISGVVIDDGTKTEPAISDFDRTVVGVFLALGDVGGGCGGDDDVAGSDPDVSEVMRDVDICFRRSAAIFRPISTSFLVTLSRAGRCWRPWPFETLAYKQAKQQK